MTDEAKKRSLFLSFCGKQTLKLAWGLLHPTDIELAQLKAILDALGKHFHPELGLMQLSAKFMSRVQQPGESSTDFITVLRQLSLRCVFTDLDNQLAEQFAQSLADGRTQGKLLTWDVINLGAFLKEVAAWEQCDHQEVLKDCLAHRAPTDPTAFSPTDDSEDEEVRKAFSKLRQHD